MLMATVDIFSKRQKHLSGKHPDVYQYDNLPRSFRVQVAYILRDVLGKGSGYAGLQSPTEEWFTAIQNFLAEEYGEYRLHEQGDTSQAIVFNFLISTNVEKVFDVIEVSFRLAYALESDGVRRTRVPDVVQDLDAVVDKLNDRFREHDIGYRFESGQMLRIDSEFLHQQAVKPALHLLQAPHFAGVEKEFRKAHKRYREQEFEDTISESLKALESTLKVICKRKEWSFSEGDTASKLIQIVLNHGLIPKYLQNQFDSLRSLLVSGVPTMRNRDSGHGRGATPRQIPAHLAAYSLHLTASAIVFLAEAAGD